MAKGDGCVPAAKAVAMRMEVTATARTEAELARVLARAMARAETAVTAKRESTIVK